MKDYFDLWILSSHTDFDGDILRQAVLETFSRRQTTLTKKAPFGLTDAFAQDAQKQLQWKAFHRKNQLEALALNDVVTALAIFLGPVYKTVGANTKLHASWQAGGPWLPVDEQ